jgi:hypothetical protein
MVLELLLYLRWEERAHAHEGSQRAFVGTQKMGKSYESRQWESWVSRRVIVTFHIA